MRRRREPAGHACQQAAGLRAEALAVAQTAQPHALFQRMAQGHQLARAHLAQRDAGGDALHVADAPLSCSRRRLLQAARPSAPSSSCMQAPWRALDIARRWPCLRATSRRGRAEQPAFEHAAAHAGHAGVEQGKQCGRALSPRRVCTAPGCGGCWRAGQSARPSAAPAPAAHAAGCGLGCVRHRSAGRRLRHARRQRIGAPGGQRCGLQLLQQFALAQARVKLKIGPQGQRTSCPGQRF
jgi:hypothetical protein